MTHTLIVNHEDISLYNHCSQYSHCTFLSLQYKSTTPFLVSCLPENRLQLLSSLDARASQSLHIQGNCVILQDCFNLCFELPALHCMWEGVT